MIDNFNRAVAFTLRPDIEGEFTDDASDRGNWTGGEVGKGELVGTKFGISAAAYPSLDIRGLSFRDATEIYRRNYWARAGCDRLPQRVAIAVFDMAVNHGVSNALKMLQGVLGVSKDGIFGPQTEAAVRSADQDELLVDLLASRLDFYRGLKAYARYGKGWTRRTLRLLMECSR